MSNPQEQPIVPKTLVISKEFISILTLIFGTLILAVTCGIVFGPPYAGFPPGVVMVVFGFVLGLSK